MSSAMDHGGAERMLSDLVVAQAESGAEVTIVAPAGELDRDWAAVGVGRALVAASGRDVVSVARSTRDVARALRRLAPDVIHAHNVKATGVSLLARGPRRRTPVLATMHGVAESDTAGATAILRRARRTVAVSDTVAETLLAHGLPAERLQVIRNGIAELPAPDDAAVAGYREQLGLGGPVVCAVGRLAAQKAHWRLLETDALVLAERGDVTFLLVGDGPLRAELEGQAARLGIERSVRFLGARRDARTLISLSDLLAFSSDWEGLSIAALEGLAAGTPVVTTDVAGMHELLDTGAGVIAESFDPAALAGAITQLLGDPDRRARMGAVGRELAAGPFSAQTMRAAYADAYARTIAAATQR